MNRSPLAPARAAGVLDFDGTQRGIVLGSFDESDFGPQYVIVRAAAEGTGYPLDQMGQSVMGMFAAGGPWWRTSFANMPWELAPLGQGVMQQVT